MPYFQKVSDLPERELAPGVFARLIHMERMSVAHVRLEEGSVVPEHRHPHEQVTNVLSGELEMIVAGEARVCRAGDAVVMAGGVPHSARALSPCRVIDVFQPVREDYR